MWSWERNAKMKKIILLMIMAICLIGFASAQSELFYKQGSTIDLKIPCFANGTYCSGSATCNITINYPNGTSLINNQPMTNQASFFNYTLNSSQTTVLGPYQSSMVCDENGTSGHSTFQFMITSSGTEPTTSKSITFGIITFVALALSALFFLLGFKFGNMPALILGILLGFVFLIVAFQFILVMPEVQAEIPFHAQLTGDYQILLWIFWVIFIFVFIFLTFQIVMAWQGRKKEKLRKWGVLLEDE